jgi:hypothetical protein
MDLLPAKTVTTASVYSILLLSRSPQIAKRRLWKQQEDRPIANLGFFIFYY